MLEGLGVGLDLGLGLQILALITSLVKRTIKMAQHDNDSPILQDTLAI